jgi:hypothetical protein
LAHDDLHSKVYFLELVPFGYDHFSDSRLAISCSTAIFLAEALEDPIHSIELSKRLRPGNNTSPSQRNTIYSNYSYYRLDLSLVDLGFVGRRRVLAESDIALRRENNS